MAVKCEPVRTMADLETLCFEDIRDGYSSTQRGDPEPGANRGRAFWHGWRNRMIDLGELPPDDASMQLAGEYVAANRARNAKKKALAPGMSRKRWQFESDFYCCFVGILQSARWGTSAVMANPPPRNDASR